MATLTDVPEPPPIPPRKFPDWPNGEPKNIRDMYDKQQREGGKK